MTVEIEAFTDSWQFCAPCYMEYEVERSEYLSKCEDCWDSGYDISSGMCCVCDAGKERAFELREYQGFTVGSDPRVIEF